MNKKLVLISCVVLVAFTLSLAGDAGSAKVFETITDGPDATPVGSGDPDSSATINLPIAPNPESPAMESGPLLQTPGSLDIESEPATPTPDSPSVESEPPTPTPGSSAAEGEPPTSTPGSSDVERESLDPNPYNWSLSGNAGTTPGTDILGTTDNAGLTIVVSDTQVIKLFPHPISPNFIGGFGGQIGGGFNQGNRVTDGVFGATIGGGGGDDLYIDNFITDHYGTIGGGKGNQAGDDSGTFDDADSATIAGGKYNYSTGDASTVGGGAVNDASGHLSTISGGENNTASNEGATIAGGENNTASGEGATICGGFYNIASGFGSTVCGGNANLASGTNSFAGGVFGRAIHDGSFVWSDNSSEANFQSTADNQFIVRATGGAEFTTSGAGLTVDGQPLWGAANDGSGSGLDADLLDGQDGSYYQTRVSSSCPAGSSIREINSDGTVVCESDDGNEYTPGPGLDLNAGEISVSQTFRLPQSCSNGQIAEWNGSSWMCGNDDSGASGVWGGGTGDAGSSVTRYFHVGSLPSDTGAGTNIDKLLVTVYGDTVWGDTMGQDFYSVVSRDGLKISHTRLFGDTKKHNIMVFQNGNLFDVVIAVEDQAWPHFAIRSMKLDKNNEGFTEQPIVDYDPSGKTYVWTQVIKNIMVDNDGRVGIGESNPQEMLHLTSNLPYIRLEDTDEGDPWLVGVNGVDDTFRIMEEESGEGDLGLFTIEEDGDVGIGTFYPKADLHIKEDNPYIRYEDTDARGSTLWETGVWGSWVDFDFVIREYGNNKWKRRFVIEEGSGDVGIGVDNPYYDLEVGGTIGANRAIIKGSNQEVDLEVRGIINADGLSAEWIELSGGDLAEPFTVNGEAQPGMVVSIDPHNPGQMRVANTAYDRKVAGCVSGANDLDPGVVLYNDGLEDEDSIPVALSGRVYCQADASYGPINAGDLLTTSDTHGHVMAVNDYEMAQGAIIGKAMSTLEEGRGLILVLISLQ
jgi:hypothetical protein